MSIHRVCHFLLLLVLAAGGCTQEEPEQAWIPPPEEHATLFLQTETARALKDIDRAEQQMGPSPADARAALGSARESLRRLSEYYFPLLEARKHCHNAYRSYLLRDPDHVARELDAVKEILLQIAARGGENLSSELQQPLEAVADAGLAVRVERSDARQMLERVSRLVNELALKGDIVLAEE